MGRTNRSRKRKDAMNRVKRERNAKKELARLKKTLGILDDAEMKDAVKDTTTLKEAKDLQKTDLEKEEEEVLAELEEHNDPGEEVEVVNEKTGKVHVYNTKTMRDQYGTMPSWKRPRKTERKIRKINHSRMKTFRQNWCAKYVPLE